MGNCVHGFKRTRNVVWHKNRNTKSIVIAFLGLDSAGKTTIVKALQGEGAESVHQTMGFSRGDFTLNKCKVAAYDLGGAERIRDIWKIYYSEVYAIVYVVDSAAASRMEENRRIVETLRGHPDLMCKPILFLLNKKDLPEAVDEMTFSENFSLHTMACENKTDIRVEGVCAVKGFGKDIDPMIIEGVSWLIERVFTRYDQLNKDIEIALKKLREKQAKERVERQHRLAKLANKTDNDETTDAQMDEVEPVASTSAVTVEAQQHIPNGSLQHIKTPPLPIDMNKTHGIVEQGVVEAYVEFHPEPPDIHPLDKEEEMSVVIEEEEERPKTPDQPTKNHILKRINNKIVPEAHIEEPVRSRESTVDYRIFEAETPDPRERRKVSPLRTKSFDKMLFQPVHRPRLLESTHDIEMDDMAIPQHTSRKTNHITSREL